MAGGRRGQRLKIKDLLNRKIIKSDVGEETFLTWKETLSYALGDRKSVV